MLIRDAEIWGGPRADLRIGRGRIVAIGRLAGMPGEQVVDACGGALLPGLHDHHIHLAGAAAAAASVRCGPPEVNDEAQLAAALRRPGEGWLRGIGYDERIAGMLDRRQLDQLAGARPVRVQDRTGRMWFLNSRALELLLSAAPPPPGLERAGGTWSGRLFDEDAWLRETLRSTPPSLDQLGREVLRWGVTGVTDMSPANDGATLDWLAREHSGGDLPQRCVVAGRACLANLPMQPGFSLGPLKLHLHENALPDLDVTIAHIRLAHRGKRPIAVHCTTETELVFTLAALREAGSIRGDRIEHAGIATDPLVEEVAALGLHVVTQPHFIAERGDLYRATIPEGDWASLYRLRGFARAGVPLAAGSDAPCGSADPWNGIRAATHRRTLQGRLIAPEEALSPEDAVALYLADPLDLTRQRRIAVGEAADLCLLDRPWAEARKRLRSADVRATIIGGRLIHNRIDQAPVERRAGAEAAA